MKKPLKKKTIAGALSLAIFFGLISCEENQVATTAAKKTNFPSQIVYNANIVQRDSGNVKVRFRAPLMEKYEYIDSPYVEVKKGLYLEFYDKKNPGTPGKIWAKYAKVIESKDFYEARGDVKVINPEGQTFKMQSIYWDRANRRMFTHDTVYITDKDGSIFIASKGMTAKDDFSEYIFYSGFGDINAQKIPSTQK